jgi:short subunit dehydrogenase-like uncharacterized protein
MNGYEAGLVAADLVDAIAKAAAETTDPDELRQLDEELTEAVRYVELAVEVAAREAAQRASFELIHRRCSA